MLQSIRDRLTGPIVWVVVGLIAIPFAFWGIDSFRTGGGDPVVAEVGSQDITQSQFRQAYEQRYQQYRSLMGDNFRADLFDENEFRQLTLESMIQEYALRQFARDSGYRASDAMLRDYLVTIPAFQKDGRFSADAYRELLQRQNLPVDHYESQVRESLVIDQLRSAVQDTMFTTKQDVVAALQLERQSRTVAVVTVPAEAFKDSVKVADEQIQEYFDDNSHRFQAPERIRLSYVELNRNKLVPADKPEQELLKAIYDAEKEARFSSPEERKAGHILFSFGADKAAARKKAEDTLDALKKGGDFAESAKGLSDDPGSKDQAGELGWVRKGMMVPEFEAALFAAKPGEIVGPIETEFGWHLIRLEEIREASVRPFEDSEVQAELAEAYQNREREERFRELSDKLEQMAFENTTLEPVAEAVGEMVQTTEWITRAGGSGIAASPEIVKAAFSEEVLQAGENSRPIANGPDSLVVIHKDVYEPARARKLEEVREEVVAELIKEAATAEAKKTADAIVSMLKTGKSLGDAMSDHPNLKVDFEGEAERRQAQLDARVAEHVFAMPRPAGGTVTIETVIDSTGNPVVVSLKSVQQPTEDTLGQEAIDRALQQRRESLAGSEFAAYLKAVEEVVSVKQRAQLQAAERVSSEEP